jgi:TRAP-type C4-dicarboxylate transport system permease large subunit
MNLFVINSMARNTPMLQTYRGVVPFLVSDMLRVVLLTAFPIFSIWFLTS